MIFIFSNDFLYSANDFYIQQEIYRFSNLKFVFFNIRFIFNNLRFAFNKLKFIKLKSFTFSNPNLDVTEYTSKAFGRTLDLVCKLYMQYASIFLHFSNVLGTLPRWCLRVNFSVSLYCPIGQWTYAKNWDGVGGLVTCIGNFTSFLYECNYNCAYSFSGGLQQNVLLV